MDRKCPKCGFDNEMATGTATEACPKCGVIYAKAEALAGATRSSAAQPVVRTPREVRLPLWPTVACGSCLVVGFFIGREQMRYQIASAVSGAFAHAFDGIGKKAEGADQATPGKPVVQTPSPQPTPAAPPKPPTVSAKLVKKGFRDQDITGSHFVKAAITFTVEFRNETDKDIRAFDGVLSFNDLLGNRINGAKLTISDALKAGQSISWQGEMEYNQFLSDHTKLRGFSLEDTAVVLTVHKILFADGSSQTEDQP